MKPRETIGVWHRIAGIFFGGVAGLVLGVVLWLVLDICGIVSGGDRILLRFAAWGAGCSALLGFLFPRQLIAVGHILGQFIPGI